MPKSHNNMNIYVEDNKRYSTYFFINNEMITIIEKTILCDSSEKSKVGHMSI